MKSIALVMAVLFAAATASVAVAGVTPNSAASAAGRSGAKIKPVPEKKSDEHTDSHDAPAK